MWVDGEELYTDRYFKKVYHRQKPFAEAIISRLNLKGKKIVSIGSGTGAEELLFAECGAGVVDCIEQRTEGCLLTLKQAKNRHIDNIAAFNTRHEKFTSLYHYDLIYTSSPSDWMHEYTWEQGIPSVYCNFIRRYMARGGFFIGVIYGGTFHGQSIKGHRLTEANQAVFIQVLKKQCEKEGWHLLEYWKGNVYGYSCLIVLSNNYIRLPDNSSFSYYYKRWFSDKLSKRVYVNERS